MNNIAILIDSTTYMSKEEFEANNFYSVPLTVNFDDVSYYEDYYDETQIPKIFSKIENEKKLSQTSQPSTDDCMKILQQIKDDGYTRIICLHIAMTVSGTVQGMQNAANQFMEENENIEIEVYDVRSAAQFAAVTVKDIARVLKRDGDITPDKINEIIDYYANNMNAYILVDNFDFLAYGGRIPSSIASMGNFFGITPIIKVNNQGALEKFKSERSQKKAMATILKLLKDMKYSKENNIILGTIYTTEDKMAKVMLQETQKVTDANIVRLELESVGCTISSHFGPKAFGIFWVEDGNF